LSAAERDGPASWTCTRCKVTASWMPGSGSGGRPADWRPVGGELHCLSCRRELAADAAVTDPADTTSAALTRARTAAMIEFEIRRVPDRANSVIARSCRTSVPAVAKARARIGIPMP
jgi:hypothetical protein